MERWSEISLEIYVPSIEEIWKLGQIVAIMGRNKLVIIGDVEK